MKQNYDGNGSGIIETEKKLINRGCENTTNEKKWKRVCPKCKKDIFYSRKESRDRFNKINTYCKSCSLCERVRIPTSIESFKLIHGEKYDYSKINYKKSSIKVEIVCSLHGSFWMTPNNHLSGKGCPKCKFEKLSDDRSMGVDLFIKKSKNNHNELYDYSKVDYVNERIKVKIVCKKHGIFFQNPSDHINGHGCPICNVSKGELKIIEFLKNNKIEYITQKTFDECRNPKTNQKLRFDFYIPHIDLLIEYDGEQHFKSGITRNFIITDEDLEYTKYKDGIKSEYAKQRGIKLIRIKYTEFKNIFSILEKEII